jgi:hypothetical protein
MDLAFDVALLPDLSSVPLFDDVNRRIMEGYPEGFRFSEGRTPHVTILQGFVAQDRRADLVAALEEAIKPELCLSSLEVTGMDPGTPFGNGLRAPSIEFRSTDALMEFRRVVLEVSQPFMSSVSRGAFWDGDVVDLCHEYVSNYLGRALDGHFFPHVTLGIGYSDFMSELSLPLPIELPVTSWAIGQMGDMCTMSLGHLWNRMA